jgi:hypothetical protein
VSTGVAAFLHASCFLDAQQNTAMAQIGDLHRPFAQYAFLRLNAATSSDMLNIRLANLQLSWL